MLLHYESKPVVRWHFFKEFSREFNPPAEAPSPTTRRGGLLDTFFEFLASVESELIENLLSVKTSHISK